MYEDYLLSHYKKGNHTIGLFAHADVVPVDDKWTVTKPFEPKIVNGELLKNESIGIEKQQNEILIYAKGISCHGATPQGSINAGGVILKALFDAPSFSKNDKEKLSFILKLLTTYDGEALNIKSTDSTYGDTTATNGIIKMEDGKLKLSLDIRYGNTFSEQKLISYLHSILSKENITFEIAKNGEPHNTDLNSRYIKACIKAYKDHTGNENAVPRINAGSTYLRYLQNVVEVGTTTKYNDANLPNGHGNAHQPNEHINLEGFFEAIEIIIKMLIEIDKAS